MLHERHRVGPHLNKEAYFFNFTAQYEKLIKETEFPAAAPMNNFTI